MVNTEIRLIVFFVAKDGEALYSQQKQDWELTMAQIMNSLFQNSDLIEESRENYQTTQVLPQSNPLQLYSGSDKQIQGIRSDRQEPLKNIVQEAVIKIIPKKKKCKKAKQLSEEALQIAVKRREAKSKGEKERYTHLNAEFQRIARRDKKAFLGDQCKEIKENNRMGKTRNLFKKIKDVREIFMQRWAH